MLFFSIPRSTPVHWLPALLLISLAFNACQTCQQAPQPEAGEPVRSAWGFEDGKLHPRTPTNEGQPVNLPDRLAPTDLDRDGLLENLHLQEGRLAILKGQDLVWESPQEWQVVQAVVADLNRDGAVEVALLVWRNFQPWPVDSYLPHGGRIAGFQNAQGQSCHLILIGWKRGAFRELWAGSALAKPLLAFTPADLDGDGKEELVALETEYDAPAQTPARSLSAWEWNGFGFTLLDRAAGAFRDLAVIPAPTGKPVLLTH